MIYPSEEPARCDLAAAHQMAVYDGLAEGTWNHFSVVTDEQRMLITPADRHWSQVSAESLVLAGDPDDVPGLPGQFWIGFRIHDAVHRSRPDAVCVLHAHPPYATALSILDDVRLIAASQVSVDFAGRVAWTDEYDGLAGANQGEAIAAALGAATALILRGHGVVVVGPTIAQAYLDLYLLERACLVQVLAMSTGQRIRAFNAEEIAALHHRDDPDEAARHFEAMREMIGARSRVHVH